ncbi:ABC transporter permease [Streptomyces tanashiensis]|uniref:ABC transporter permease n=1 Tax=Streptomyces tanashiensis TaxID=67367 RepID=UPI00341B04EF
MLQRPARSLLTPVGSVLGVGSFVAVLGWTSTASSRIGERFSALSATEATFEGFTKDHDEFVDLAFPADGEQQVGRLNGVKHAGVYWPVRLQDGDSVRSAPVGVSRGGEDIHVVAASSGVLDAAGPSMVQGRNLDVGHDRTRRRVAVVGSGAAAQLGVSTVETQPAVLDPAHPQYFKAMPPPDPRSLRGKVTGDLDQLILLLAAICLVMGAVGIARTTLVAVLERTSEIGPRRALGARGRHITTQFLTESATLGALGVLVGTSLGTLTVVGVAIGRDGTPGIRSMTVTTAPAIGLATGLPTGLYPAWRASRITSVEALRR